MNVQEFSQDIETILDVAVGTYKLPLPEVLNAMLMAVAAFGAAGLKNPVGTLKPAFDKALGDAIHAKEALAAKRG